jgi:glycosyltransferase involved in cell wall biosynthesis
MTEQTRLRVAALIDLPRSAQSGGHVKCWERLAHAAARSDLPLDLTVYFSGPESLEILSPHVRIRQLPPIFTTANLKFLPYIPDHTDLAKEHPRLARELESMDVLHTTDGFFAFARTAEKLSRRYGIPLVTSFHTDTPSYARIFTRQAIEGMFGKSRFAHFLTDTLRLPERQERKMIRRLKKHVKACRAALATRKEDIDLAAEILGAENVSVLRLGVDRQNFGPHRADRAGIEKTYRIPQGSIVGLFVGRLDVGKNIYTLIEAAENLIRRDLPFHLIAAGIGPAAEDIQTRLGDHASVPGFVQSDELARLYASVDLLTLCSEVEIRSMACVEALASGCPVLVSQKSGIAELFHHTSAMRTVESGVPAWEEALRSFMTNPVGRDEMRVTARLYGEEHLASWQDVLAADLFATWKKAATLPQEKDEKL